jgi:hypothetical protein
MPAVLHLPGTSSVSAHAYQNKSHFSSLISSLISDKFKGYLLSSNEPRKRHEPALLS